MKIDKYPLKKYNGFYGVVLIQLKKETTLLKKEKCRKSTRPEGIEPPSQEPESYVISTTLRAQARLLV